MLKIALVSEHASPLATVGSTDGGGQNIYVAQLALNLAAIGHEVDVFTRRDDRHLEPVVQWAPRIRVVHVPAGPARHVPKEELLPTMKAFSDFLCRFVRREPRAYDVLHANFFMSGMAAQQAACAFHIPLVITFHALGLVRRRYQGTADRFPDLRIDIESELVRTADRIVAECPQDRADLVSLYHADPAKLDVVPCGFDPSEMVQIGRSEARALLGWPPERFTVLQLGRIVPRKGIANVLHGLERLRAAHGVDAHLYVVGGDSPEPDERLTPELGRLRALARKLDLDDHVSFLGRRDREELAYHYRAADVFVSTPWYEPFGITPVEAMACGVPVIGADVGGIRTTVLDRVTGRLVPPEDPEALAAVLAELAADAELRERYGRAGLCRAHTGFTWRLVTRRVLRSYQRARAAHARPRATMVEGALALQAVQP